MCGNKLGTFFYLGKLAIILVTIRMNQNVISLNVSLPVRQRKVRVEMLKTEYPCLMQV